MTTAITTKGQVTIPKKIRDALQLAPGNRVEFDVNTDGQVVLHKAGTRRPAKPDRFEKARGRAQIKWRTDQLMVLLRGE
jgi:AbrB family looped-hinge helix DNA binding protein